jgi:hypothetical protein
MPLLQKGLRKWTVLQGKKKRQLAKKKRIVFEKCISQNITMKDTFKKDDV